MEILHSFSWSKLILLEHMVGKYHILIHVFLNDRIQNHETEFMNSLKPEKSNYKKLFNLIFNSDASIKVHTK